MKQSSKLFSEAKRLMPGGVNSPVRAFGNVNRNPIFIKKAKGSRVWGEDGKTYIDYVASWGPLILGHTHPEITKALCDQVKLGTSFGACHKKEIELANLIIKCVPSIEMVRLVNSGTEATMSAVRLARGYTGREKIIKFSGNYHGHFDDLLAQAGSGVLTCGIPGSPGVPKSHVKNTIVIPFNNTKAFTKAIDKYGNDIACVIVEPIPGNMGVVIPSIDFLTTVRKRTREEGIVLIFDEVITGFRVSLGGAQKLFGIKPDLTCLGKIIGGGLPVGAYGGRREIMKKVAPSGDIYQAGTLSGNPLAVKAGIRTIEILQRGAYYDWLNEMTDHLCEEIIKLKKRAEMPFSINRVGSMFTIFYTDKEVFDYESAKKANLKTFTSVFKSLLSRKIYIPPSQFEASFVSIAHSHKDIKKTIEAYKKILIKR